MAITYIWISFFVISWVYGLIRLIQGDLDIFTSLVNATFTYAKTAFEIALFLTGVLSLWLGLLKIAERGGLIQTLAKLISPLFARIFPDLPRNHPAMGSMLMNISANMIGLDNAATPLGLKAMQQLQSLNKTPSDASNAQIMFLVLNTSGLTIIPISIMAFRAQAGSLSPSDIFLPTFLATSIASLAALLITSAFQKVIFDLKLITFIAGALLAIAGILALFSSLPTETANTISSVVSNLILFSAIVYILLLGLRKKLNVYEEFIHGAKEGFDVAIKIVPHLVGILVAIGVFRASGALDLATEGISWGLSLVGLEGDHTKAIPLALMRPLSGSGARSMMLDVFETYGVDSWIGRLASVMQGTSDTTFYILAIYFGSVSIRNGRHALTCGLSADIIGFISAVIISYIFFS